MKSFIKIGCFSFVLILFAFTFIIGKNPFDSAIARSRIAFSQEVDVDKATLEQELKSNEIRVIKVNFLFLSIARNPIFGNGLGAAINYDDGLVEYFYYDVINKMGLIGLILYILPFLNIVYVKRARRKSNEDIMLTYLHIIIMAGLVYFFIITASNPSMNTTTGILYYAISVAVISMIKNDRKRIYQTDHY